MYAMLQFQSATHIINYSSSLQNQQKFELDRDR